MRRAEEEVAEVTARHAAILDRLREGDGKAENSLLNEIHLSFNRDSEKGDLKRRRCDDIEEELEVDEIVPDSSFSDLFGPLKEEVLEVCGQLRALVDHIRQQEKNSLTSLETLSSSSSTSSHSFTHFKVGMLMELVKELRGLILALLRGRGVRSDSLSLEAEVHHLREALEALQIDLQAKLHDIQRQESLVRSLQQQLEICRVKEEGLQEQIQVLQSDLEDTHLSKDQLIRKAWDVRDQAVARKNKAEIELAKARIESLQVNSQLLEAVQQKVELSQQLEQWQVDMQSLLDEQLKEKLRSQELARRKPSTPSVESNQSQGGSTRTARFLRLLRRRSRDDS
ncbi:unnamed protein product [Darwinula stevensoni]|uniref:Bicaudal D-related protein 1 n=1 Tax=Darwinula stevensoni TaxID=69355 RepID=A0A7R9A9M2_9CRUS|nr:unnamed protein product [Darwinula stevensoni]CAG0897556.1 unnamed protein product [Darwinula stevensoni]